MKSLNEQQEVQEKLDKIFKIFKATEGAIRPHFILTGASGSGKSYSVELLTISNELDFVEINAAQLTKEGLSGNSLSKALTPLINKSGKLTVVFVDEFDKLFISGNNNELAHESTSGVQNEFLKVIEGSTAQVFGDYGKYVSVPTDKTLFVFAGAFNGVEDLTLDKLRDFGIKTEFLGRVGLLFNLKKPSLESMYLCLEKSKLLQNYIKVFRKDVTRDDVVSTIKSAIRENYEKNTLGVRMINTFLHKYFINGGNLTEEDKKESSFQTELSLK